MGPPIYTFNSDGGVSHGDTVKIHDNSTIFLSPQLEYKRRRPVRYQHYISVDTNNATQDNCNSIIANVANNNNGDYYSNDDDAMATQANVLEVSIYTVNIIVINDDICIILCVYTIIL